MDQDVRNWFLRQQPQTIKDEFEIKAGRLYYKDDPIESLTINWPILRVNGKVIPSTKIGDLDRLLRSSITNNWEDLRTQIRPYIHRVESHEYNF